MSPVTPRPWLFVAALAALASCSLQHPADPGDAGPDVDVPGDTPRPDADVPSPDDVTDATDVADAAEDARDAAMDARDAAEDADAAMDAPDVTADADAPDADAATDAPDDVSDAGDAMDVADADAPPDVPDAGPDDAPPDACAGAACVYASCADLPRGSASGAYNLRGTGGTTWRGYCLVNPDNSPAWTLVMKVDGARSTFQYDSVHWETLSRLDDGVADLSRRDAKYEGYNATPVRQILLFTNTNPAGDRAVIVTAGDAPRLPLLSLMQMRPPPVMTITGLDAWAPIFPDARLQAACRRFGFNVNPTPGPTFARVRLGGVGDESDATCSSPDSWVGVGGFVDNNVCGSRGSALSAGNVSGCDGAPAPRAAPAFVWIYVR
ncbi:MAG: hypothetical protein U0324_14955 [Polyangiales bacterium]